jgi:predicted benzoate:H+ symporter BenE
VPSPFDAGQRLPGEAGIAGALAFFVAASDFELWGNSAAFWGLVVGMAAMGRRRHMRQRGHTIGGG